MEEAKFKVPTELIFNEQSPPLDIAVYAYLSIMSVSYLNHPICIAPNAIAYEIYGEPTAHAKDVSDSILRICQQYPSFVKQLSANAFLVDYQAQSNTIRYISIWQREMESILHSQYAYKISILKMFAVILGSLQKDIQIDNRNYFATTYPENWYSRKMNIALETIRKYFRCLESLQLIYVIQSPHKSNLIGRLSDRKLLLKWGSENGYQDNSDDTNRKRSLMQKFNRFKKAKKSGAEIPYSSSELKEIKQYIKDRNEKYRAWANFDPSAYDKIIDMSIFS